MKPSSSFLTLAMLALPSLATPAGAAALYVPPGCLLLAPPVGTGPGDCPGSVAGDPMHDAVHGAPLGEYIDAVTGVVYEQLPSGLSPIGVSSASLGYLQLTTCGNHDPGDKLYAEECGSTSPTAGALMATSSALRPDCDRPGRYSWKLCHMLHVATVDCVEVKVEYTSTFWGTYGLEPRVYSAPECRNLPLLPTDPTPDNIKFTTQCNFDGACLVTELFRHVFVPCAISPTGCVNGVAQEFTIGPTEAIADYEQVGECWFRHPYQQGWYLDHDPNGGTLMPEILTATLTVGGERIGPTQFKIC